MVDPFFPFLLQIYYFQQIKLCHAQNQMGPQHHAEFQTKSIRQFLENVWMDECTDLYSYNPSKLFNSFCGEWPGGLQLFDRIRRLPVQTSLDAQPG